MQVKISPTLSAFFLSLDSLYLINTIFWGQVVIIPNFVSKGILQVERFIKYIPKGKSLFCFELLGIV